MQDRAHTHRHMLETMAKRADATAASIRRSRVIAAEDSLYPTTETYALLERGETPSSKVPRDILGGHAYGTLLLVPRPIRR